MLKNTMHDAPSTTAAAALPALGAPIIAAVNLHKTYRMGRVNVPVLRGVSLSVQPGEWVAILGASGSGKSTLLHLLGGLDRPTSHIPSSEGAAGSIRFGDQSLTDLSQAALDRYRNQSVGFVFQFYHLLPELNIEENVLVPAMARFGRFAFAAKARLLRERARLLLADFGLSHRYAHRPAELSGGERQRVAIARALINDPPLLLADEPTGNLDRTTGDAILDQLASQRARDRRTLVMVTHDLHVARRADRVVHLADGLIVQNT